MKCQHEILNIYHRGYDTNPCKREAKYRITYWNGASECVCGRCKGAIIRTIKSEELLDIETDLKIETL